MYYYSLAQVDYDFHMNYIIINRVWNLNMMIDNYYCCANLVNDFHIFIVTLDIASINLKDASNFSFT